MMQPPCRVQYGGEHPEADEHGLSKHRALKCHSAECARYFLQGRPEGSRTWVITSNRNPFSRYPSEMFQHISKMEDEEIKKFKMRDLFSFFHNGAKKEYDITGALGRRLKWYDGVFQQALGLDILKHPFDFDKKFLRVQHVFDNRTLEILVLRLEDSTEWPAILKPFFPTFQLVEDYIASDKSSVLASKYEEFMSGLQFTNEEINHISKSDELNHFYTREEQNAFIPKEREPSSGTKKSGILAEDLVLEDRLDLGNLKC